MNKWLKISLLLIVLLFYYQTKAQELEDSPPPVEATPPSNPSEAPVSAGANKGANLQRNKKVNIGFDDELVKGRVNNPEVDYLFARKQFNFKKLIKLREDFIPEVQKGKVEYGAGD